MASMPDVSPDLKAALGDHWPDFTLLPKGRLRCELTGHEVMPTSEQVRVYIGSKNFSSVLSEKKLDQTLKKFEPHIVPSPQFKDKLLCTLTGKLVKKSETAVWNHMLGQKFQKSLAKKEAELAQKREAKSAGSEKEATLTGHGDDMEVKPNQKETKKEKMAAEPQEPGIEGNDNEEKEMGGVRRKKGLAKPDSGKKSADKKVAAKVGSMEREPEMKGKKKLKRKEPEGSGQDAEGVEQGNDEGFWMPPIGVRWDGDAGEERWGGSDPEAEEGEETAGNKGKKGEDVSPSIKEDGVSRKRAQLKVKKRKATDSVSKKMHDKSDGGAASTRRKRKQRASQHVK